MEIQYAEAFICYFATPSLAPEVLLDDENQRIEISRKPLGVVAATIPWNYPLLNPWVSTTIRFKQLN